MAPMKSKEKEELLEILRTSDSLLRNFRDRVEDKDVIIFLGNTRDGKSTLVNYINGVALVAFEDNNYYKITLESDRINGSPIAHGSLSHTTVPIITTLTDVPNTLIIDAPGFDDNRGILQEITNALHINQIKYAKSLRFVLVSDINNITNDNINQFLNLIGTVQTIISDFSKLQHATSIIFTKDYKDYKVKEIITLLKTKILNEHELRFSKDLIKHFIEHEELVGLFKMPSKPGLIGDEIDFNIKSAIFNSSKLNPLVSDIKYGLSQRAKVALFETYLDFFDTVIELKDVFHETRTKAENELNFVEETNLPKLSERQLQDSLKIIGKFKAELKSFSSNVIDVCSIHQVLKQIFIFKMNDIHDELKQIGIELPEFYNRKMLSARVEQVQKKIEYILAIEKIVEKNNKSENILIIFHDSLKDFLTRLTVLDSDLWKEINLREELLRAVGEIPKIEEQLLQIDHEYLFASFEGELRSMHLYLNKLLLYARITIERISMRPHIKCSQEEMFRLNETCRKLERCLEDIKNYLISVERFLVPRHLAPLMKLMGGVFIYSGFGYFRSFSRMNQFRVVAGSVVILAAASITSRSLKRFYSKIYKRYRQNRLFSCKTILDRPFDW